MSLVAKGGGEKGEKATPFEVEVDAFTAQTGDF